MNTEINQKISQFLDDELTVAELDELLVKIKKQPDLKNKMNRYQVMTQVMKMDHAVMANVGFLDNINLQLEREPNYLLPVQKEREKQKQFWQKTSLAVAASIACIAVIMSQKSVMQPNEQSLQTVASLEEAIEVPPVQMVKKRQNSQHERFKAYLQAHNDDLYTHGSLNAYPFAQVASYGQE